MIFAILCLLMARAAGADNEPLTKKMCPPGTRFRVRSEEEPKKNKYPLARLLLPGAKRGAQVKTSWCERPTGVKHGPWRSCDADADTCMRGPYDEGRKHGVWTLYLRKVKLAEEPYRHGKRHGRCRTWGLSGRGPYIDQQYNDGVADPLHRVYSSEGKLLGTYSWHNGTGVFKEWYSNGRLALQCPQRDSKKHGRCEEWFEDGSRKSDCHYREGDRHGQCTSWWSKDKLQERGTFLAGRAHGPAESWTHEGKLKERGTYHNGHRQGRFTRADDDGQTFTHVYGAEGALISTTKPKHLELVNRVLPFLRAGAQVFFSEQKVARFPPVRDSGWTPRVPCCKQPGRRCAPDKATWSRAPWSQLKFHGPDSYDVQLRYRSNLKKDLAASCVIEARLDADCDGTYATFKLSISFNEDAERIVTGPVITNLGE